MFYRTEMTEENEAKPRNRIFGWSIIAILCTAGLIYFLLPAIQQPRSGKRSHNRNNLKRIGIALHNYHSKYGSLPPAYIENEKGEKIHSWRGLILPYMGEVDEIFYSYKLSEPWYSKHNRKVARDLAQKFKGRDRFWSSVNVKSESTETDYVVVVGPQTAFPGKRSVNFKDIKDGLSNTIFVLQMRHSGIDWFEPRDLGYEQVDADEERNVILKTKEWHNYILALIGDGSAQVLNDTGDAEQWRNFLFINDGNGIFWPEIP